MNAITTKPKLTHALELKDAPKEILLWVEKQLEVGGFLSSDQANGLYGSSTDKAFRAFKEVAYLERPTELGAYTLDKLALLAPPDKVSEQSLSVPTKVLTTTGTKTGRSVTLPVVGLVYENEEIVPGSFLTWSEMLRGFTRMPAGSATFGSEEQLVRNMIRLAEVFRIVRGKFGSPCGINSAYRPPNLAIGASRSQHKYARALDIRPMNDEWRKLLEVIRSVDEIRGIGLAGKSKGFWHFDLRPGDPGDRVEFAYG